MDKKINSWISRHLIAVIESMQIRPRKILDVGCGDGQNMILMENLYGGSYGYDVSDGSCWNQVALDNLRESRSDINWSERFKIIRSDQNIPFEDNFFDLIYSNQVIEHVNDILLFRKETMRVLKPGGIAIHIFPLKEIIYEGHIRMPYAHRNKSERYIKFWNSIGIGRLSRDAKKWHEFFENATFYRDYQQIKSIFPDARFDYSLNALLQKFKQCSLYKIAYGSPNLMKYIGPVTMTIVKK